MRILDLFVWATVNSVILARNMNEEMSLPVNVGISIKLYMNCTANSLKFLLELYKVIIAWFGFESCSSKAQ